MQIFIQSSKTEAVEVEPTEKIGSLDFATDIELTLSYAGQILSEDMTFEEACVQEGSTITASVPLLGGGKKRKKKVYTTPKKIKHKKTKVKLATLKYYKVDDTGKIERKRKECPADICGPGIFMSNHKDRQYCGKCGLTIKF